MIEQEVMTAVLVIVFTVYAVDWAVIMTQQTCDVLGRYTAEAR